MRLLFCVWILSICCFVLLLWVKSIKLVNELYELIDFLWDKIHRTCLVRLLHFSIKPFQFCCEYQISSNNHPNGCLVYDSTKMAVVVGRDVILCATKTRMIFHFFPNALLASKRIISSSCAEWTDAISSIYNTTTRIPYTVIAMLWYMRASAVVCVWFIGHPLFSASTVCFMLNNLDIVYMRLCSLCDSEK